MYNPCHYPQEARREVEVGGVGLENYQDREQDLSTWEQ